MKDTLIAIIGGFIAGIWTQRLGFRYQLRLAVVTDRLNNCQEAHTRLDKLANNLNNATGLHESNQECYQWYASHSLSLTEPTRRAYYNACLRSAGIFTLIGNPGRQARTDPELQAIQTALDAVVDAIEAVAAEHASLCGMGTPFYARWKDRLIAWQVGRRLTRGSR